MRNHTAQRSLHGGVAGVLLVFVAASVLCGCDKIIATRKTRLSPRPGDKIRVEEMADRLELMLESRCPYSAKLVDGLNSVMIFADPQGQAYVNGRAAGLLPGGRVSLFRGLWNRRFERPFENRNRSVSGSRYGWCSHFRLSLVCGLVRW